MNLAFQTSQGRPEMSSATGQGLVHRAVGGAIPADPGLVAQRLADRLADGYGAVFGGVVLVDVEVALHVAFQIDQRVTAELLDHVIEKADPG